MQDFRNLTVWQQSHELVLAVYRDTQVFEKTEIFGLRSQIRRAAVSIPSNIAEGCCRGSDADFRRFLLMALGSSSELEYQLLLAADLGYLERRIQEQLTVSLVGVRKMLNALANKLGGT
jgi:four helix bundle protein